MFLTISADMDESIKTPGYREYGSAGDIDGTTIVVSIFANDANTGWDDPGDEVKEANINNYINIAASYIEDNVSAYGKSAAFITDFKKNDDLKYRFVTDEKLTDNDYIDNGDPDSLVWEYIASNIDETSLMEKYDADNVIYMLFVDSNEDNTAISCTRTWYDDMPYDSEIVYLFNYDDGYVNGPAVYAHEMLHTFGAPDLYTADSNYNIDDDFVDFAYENMPNDIMLTCSDEVTGDYLYDSVNNEIGEVTAYYVGLTDHSDIVDKWNLYSSEHPVRR